MSSDRPTTRAWRHNPFKVAIETGIGTGKFVIDERCALQELTLGCDELLSSAIIAGYAGPVYTTGEEELKASDVLDGQPRTGFDAYLSPDQQIMIVRELDDLPPRPDYEEGDEQPPNWEIVFRGYADLKRYDERSSPMGSNKMFTFPVESVLKRIADTDHAQIVGRRMRTRAKQLKLETAQARDDTTAFGAPTDILIVPAAPCVFNAGGKPNRAASPVTITAGTESAAVHVFADDNDPDAKYWTWAQMLRYLLFWHLLPRQAGESLDSLGDLIIDGNIVTETEELLEEDIDDRPETPVDIEEALEYALLGRPADFNCDGLSVAEALILLTDAAGIHFKIKTAAQQEEVENEETGETEQWPTGLAQDRIYVWARGAGTVKDFHREGEQEGEDAEQLLAKNDLSQLGLAKDYSDVILKPDIRGDVRRYEVTVELLPGWEPDANLDDVAEEDWEEKLDYAAAHEDVKDDQELLEADPWYQRYHARGSLHHEYRQVGRRWVLNETGLYSAGEVQAGDVYGRTLGEFTAERYATPFRPTDAGITDTYIDDTGVKQTRTVEENDWVLRGRPLKECFSADAEQRSMGIIAEFSFDGGSTWQRTGATIRALIEEAGIYIEQPDLWEMAPDGVDKEEMNVWMALIQQLLRVRVTAVIEGDDRIQPNLNASVFGPPCENGTSRVFNVAAKFHSNRREGGNSQFAPGGDKEAPSDTLDAGDDIEALQQYAGTILEACTSRQQPSILVVPWLTTDYEVGDGIRSITGMGVTFWTNSDSGDRRHPDVVAVKYTPADTSIVLEDFRLLDQLKRGPQMAEG